MIRFNSVIEQFDKKGEKSRWSYIIIDQKRARKLNGDARTSFRVKGKLDDFMISRTAVLPMGDGTFILPINARMRKGTGKKTGDILRVQLELDERSLELSKDFILSLRDDANALEFFKSLPRSHQQYFSNWIESAKTIQTKTRRITMAVIALGSKQGYGEMIRANKAKESSHKGF
jgi:hypothetical protein